MGNTIIKPTNIKSVLKYIPTNPQQGRWVLKNSKHENINSYWNNVDNCGDKICGNITETKKMLDKEIADKKI
jgi:hypothetical protein